MQLFLVRFVVTYTKKFSQSWLNSPFFFLFFARHGESENNIVQEATFGNMELFQKQRTVDPSLTKKGVEQAKQLALLLEKKHAHITKLLVSPMKRTLQTAAPLAEALGVRAEIWPEIFEEGGLYHTETPSKTYTGLKRSEILQMLPDANVPFDDSGWYHLGKQESRQECRERAKEVAKKLRQMAAAISIPEKQTNRHRPPFPPVSQHVWIVSHGTFLFFLMQEIIGTNKILVHHNNVGISCLTLFPPEGTLVSVKFLNRIIHSNPIHKKSQNNQESTEEIEQMFHPLLSLDYKSKL